MTGQVLTSQNTTRADVQEKGCMLIVNKLLGYFWYSKKLLPVFVKIILKFHINM